jgi:purine-binding chemotaxis protein CheW
MMALQGYLDDMLSVATESVAHEEVAPKVEVKESLDIKAEVENKPLETAVIEVPQVEAQEVTQPTFVEPEMKVKPVQKEVTKAFVEPTEPVALTGISEASESILSKTTSTEEVSVKAIKNVVIPEKVSKLQEEKQPYPAWAASGFECLLFYVGGLKLAVPLVLLGGIHRIDKDLTPLFGQPDWFLGLYSRTTMDGQQNIRVVHTSRWVMPEKPAEDIDPLNHYVISLGDSDWGLLSHKLSDSIRLMPDQVKWRTAVGKRPWLAGTVIDHMCAILDVNSMVDLLNKNSKRIA